MTELKTKESTLKALEKAARRSLSPDEIQQQRISFVMGSLDADSSITRDKVEQLLALLKVDRQMEQMRTAMEQTAETAHKRLTS